jgi:hypothetical protein
MTRFYLAASWDAKTLMRKYRDELSIMGHKITSRWIGSPDHEEGHTPGSLTNMHRGIMDREDIDECDVLLLFTDSPSTTGGYHVEFGYALGMGKVTVVIGPYTNIFQRQCTCSFMSWEDFLRGFEA